MLNVAFIPGSAVSFLGYGAACFLSNPLKQEWVRYRFGSQRRLIGGLPLCAAAGLLAGLSQPWMGRAAAGGLALMLLVAGGVRIKIKDTLLQASPALFDRMRNTHPCLAVF